MAGWTGPDEVYEGTVAGATKMVHGIEYELTAEADGSVADHETVVLAGGLANLVCVFGSPAPNSIVLTIKDEFGATVLAETTFSATGYADPDTIKIFLPGKLTFSVSGNTVSGAKAKIIPILI